MTVKRSPNKRLIKSTFTSGIKVITTSPHAKDVCDSIPSKVSEARSFFCSNPTNTNANARQVKITDTVGFNEKIKPNAIPNSDVCASVSPKYAIRRQTINVPRGPVINATPIPASIAYKRTSIMAASIFI